MRKYSPSLELVKLLFSLTLMLTLTILADAVLHRLGYAWVGRYLGIPGVLLIVLSFIYSVRKRKIIKSGKIVAYLAFHETLGWFGALLLFIHAGIHFNAVLPWLAVMFMFFNVISGLTGKLLLKKSVVFLNTTRADLENKGLNYSEVKKMLFWDALAVGIMKKWRAVHLPIAIAFFTFAVIHIFSILIFW